MPDKNTISAAVIGVGHLGQWHARKIAAMSDVRLAAVMDLNIERAKALAAELNCPALGEADVLPDDLQAAVIAVPTSDHFAIADRLLDRGIDLLIEKPIAETVEEATNLVEKARRLGRTVAVGHIERMNPAYKASIGRTHKPFLIEARRLAPLKERAKGIDVVRDLMIHDIDLALQIAGADATVQAATGAKVITDKIDVARAHLSFNNGVQAYLIASRVHAVEVREIEVFDAKGCMHINCRDRTSGRYESTDGGMAYKPFPVKEADALEEELKDFFNSVRNRTQPAATAEDGLRALALCTEITEKIKD